MPVVQTVIKTEILALLNNTANLELEQSKEQFATLLAQAVYNAITSATVTLAPGSIITTGSAVTQTNLVPAIGTLS